MQNISTLLHSLLLSAYFISYNAFSGELSTSFSFNKLYQSLCLSAKKNDLIKLRSELTKARTHIRTVYLQVECEGQTLLSIADTNHANSVSRYLKLKANPEIAPKSEPVVPSLDNQIASSEQ